MKSGVILSSTPPPQATQLHQSRGKLLGQDMNCMWESTGQYFIGAPKNESGSGPPVKKTSIVPIWDYAF